MAYFPCYVALLLLFSFHSLCYSRRRHCCMYIHFPAVLGKYFEGTKKISAFISFFFYILYVSRATTVYRSIRDDRVYGMNIFFPFLVHTTAAASLFHIHPLIPFNVFFCAFSFLPIPPTHLICFIIFLNSFHGMDIFLPLKFI